MKIEGYVTESNLTYKRKTYVKPIIRYYGIMPNGKHSVKYSCPVCESLNNHFSFTYGIENCPLCNVNLTWKEIE